MKAISAKIVGVSKVKKFNNKNGKEFERQSLFVQFENTDVVGSAVAQVDIYSDFNHSVNEEVSIVYDRSKFKYDLLEF